MAIKGKHNGRDWSQAGPKPASATVDVRSELESSQHGTFVKRLIALEERVTTLEAYKNNEVFLVRKKKRKTYTRRKVSK